MLFNERPKLDLVKGAAILIIVVASFFIYIMLHNLTAFIKTIAVDGLYFRYSFLLYGRYCKLTIDPFAVKTFISIGLPIVLRTCFLAFVSQLIRGGGNNFLGMIVAINIMLDLIYVFGVSIFSKFDWDVYYFSSPAISIGFIY